MDPKPLVSVIMPIYGVEKYIENSVKSVIAQTYDNIELILVDDGSPDHSVEIAERVLKDYQFSYELIHQENAGLGYARNAGFRKANGEWIIFFDSDDVILPKTIERFVSALDDNDTDLVFCGFRYIHAVEDLTEEYNDGRCIKYSPIQLQRDFLLRNRKILASGTMIKREVLEKNDLYFSMIPWSEDQHFLWRLLAFIKGAVYIDDAMYQYLQHEGSIMAASKIEKMISSYPVFCELRKYYERNELVKSFLVSRWVMGTLNAAARITDFVKWKELFSEIDGKQHMKKLLHFPSNKVNAAARICLFSKKLFYELTKKT